MKKFKIMKIISVIYTVLWIAFLLIAVIGRLTYNNPSAEPLEANMDMGIYNLFIWVAAAGLLSALSLLFGVLLTSDTQTKRGKAPAKTAFALSIITNVLFYLSFVLLFLINKDWIIFAPIMWAICLVGTAVMLVVALVTTVKARQTST